MNWKQPIPTNIEGLTRRELTVFQHILLRCANKTQSVKIGDHEIILQRGQCIFGRYEFADELLLDRNQSMKVQRILDKLEKVSNLVSKQKSKNCSIITVKNYDDYISFEQSSEQSVSNQRAISEQSVSTNKNDKNEESEKSERDLSSFEKFKLQKEEVIKELSEKYPARDVPKAWKLLVAYYETHDGSKITDWRKHFENKVHEDKFKSFTITPRFKAPEKPPIFHVSQRELSPAEKEKAHRNTLRLREISLAKKKPHHELTREERIAQITGFTPISKAEDPDKLLQERES